MPNYFLTKTWGFNPPTHPVLGISQYGARRTFLQQSNEDDWVLIAGTASEPTIIEERGRLLGMVRLGRNEVSTESVLNFLGTPISIKDRHKITGEYLWPYALPMLEAYRFVDKPLISSVFGSGLSGFAWVKNVRSISHADCTLQEAIDIIEGLRREPVDIAEIPEFTRQLYQQRMLAAGRTGPGPSTTRAASSITEGSPVTYCLKLAGTKRFDAFKIGYTNNLDRRHRELNQGLISELTGFSWEQYMAQPQESGIAAFICEQLVHEALARYRVKGQQEIYKVAERELMSVWNGVMADPEKFLSNEAIEQYAPHYDALSSEWNIEE